MDKETEEWFKEINEKSKQRLKEHFEEKKHQRWCEEQLRELTKPKTELHYGTDWEIDPSEFDDITDESSKFKDDLIWEDLTDSDNKKDKGSE